MSVINEEENMIYLVEDEKNIRDLVVYTLNSAGLETKGFERSCSWKSRKEKESTKI